ncbi:MAG: DUF488 domain-containing protein [Candidatus Hatepunaea meridiana]|nr:DUF488 domain-containing protein [Candidatus Hatepunaea meridiana]
MRPLLTIGIGTRDVDGFIEQLKKHSIDYVIDIRTSPYSKYKPEFNKEGIQRAIKQAGIRYGYWGKELGGLPTDPYVLTNGRVDYTKLARRPEFVQGLERLTTALEKDYKLAIFCSEGRPEECHRTKCIGVELTKWEVEVLHIDIDGSLVTHNEVMSRITSDQITLEGLEKPLVSKKRWDKEQE